MNILTIGSPRMIPGMTQGLSQQSIMVTIQIDLPSPISGLTHWIELCCPELKNNPLPVSSENSEALDAQGIARWIALLASALQHYLGEPVGWGTAVGIPIQINSNPLLHWITRLSSFFRAPFRENSTERTNLSGHYSLAVPFHRSECGHMTLEIAQHIIQDGIEQCLKRPQNKRQPSKTLRQLIDKQLKTLQEHTLHESTSAILQAANRRNIPWLKLVNDIYQLGYACKSRRTTRAYYTESTSRIGMSIAQHKPSTSALLSKAKLPVPQQGGVATSPEQCVTLAEQLGYPVVIKPVAGKQGKGVIPGLKTSEDVLKACLKISSLSEKFLIEKHVEGKDYRLMIVGGRMIAATCRIPAGVTGDGKHSIKELIAQTNLNRGPKSLLIPLILDDDSIEVLATEGFTPESIPEPDTFVKIRRQANGHTGGTSEEVTHHVHPDNQSMAERAARIVGLDIAGIDFLTPDISRSYLEVGGAINEVNGGPGFTTLRIANPAREHEAEVLDWMFEDSNGRIPIAALTGMNENTTVAPILHRILLNQNATVGLSTILGVWIGEHLVSTTYLSGYHAGRILLIDPTVNTAIIELPHQSLIESGCPFDQCDVAALLDVPNLPMSQIESDVLIRAQHAIVANAEHHSSTQLIEVMEQHKQLEEKQMIWIAQNAAHPIIQQHLTTGGTAVLLGDQNGQKSIFVHIGGEHQWLIPLDDIHPHTPTTASVTDNLFAIALAYAMGCSLNQIRSGLNRSNIQSPA